ncbi:MAG: hypothetical protein HY430_04020, partial [Candidatus Levybacteria bacterium]|nr:hypothetical protein [Candidatus Levybacteria bacterium]
MKILPVQCSYCKKTFYRSTRRFNEARKYHWNSYCSSICLTKARNKQKILVCANCSKIFKRQFSDLKKSNSYYCSLSCAAIVNNTKFPKHLGLKKTCAVCKKVFVSREKYCSVACKNKDQIIPKEIILKRIQRFYNEKGRIPFKQEFAHARAARVQFGTWNNTIIAAGFTPNPVMFAKKFTANDTHKCDSLAEKIIDDWLFARKIKHLRSAPYPGNKGFTVDFVIDEYWIEFFGLYGEHKRYDELREIKLQMIKQYNFKFIGIYPYHL